MKRHKSKLSSRDVVVEQWFVAEDTGGPRIKRFKKQGGRRVGVERLPIEQYRHLLANRKELERFVIRLNGRDPDAERAQELHRYRQAFLANDLLADYRDHFLPVHIPTAKDRATMYHYLIHYAIDWFVHRKKLPNPVLWHMAQEEWGKYLLNDHAARGFQERLAILENGVSLSSKVLRQVVNELNRFLRYLHQKRPREVPPLKFAPFSAAILKRHDADRKLSEEFRESKYIKDEHWKTIAKELERRSLPWRHAVYLMHKYGLRRNEALGLLPKDVRHGYLSIERQLARYETVEIEEVEVFSGPSKKKNSSMNESRRRRPEQPTKSDHPNSPSIKKVKIRRPKHAPVKDRDQRRVPHWFSEPSKAYELIIAANACTMHPDTITHDFSLLMRELGLPAYVIKDLRLTWITNALRAKKDAEDVRLAAGHADMQTTYRHYVADIRELDEEVWHPEGGVA